MLATLFVVAPLEPQFYRDSLDSSWDLVLHWAYAARIRHGHQLVFTYGPLGFVWGRNYHPATWPVSIGIWLVLAIVLYWNVVQVLCRRLATFASRALVAAVVVSFAATGSDQLLTLFLLLVPVRYYYLDERRTRPGQLVLVAATAMLGLIKGSLLFAGAVVVAIIAFDEALGQRRVPTTIVVLLLGLLAGWLGTGQLLEDGPAWLAANWQYASGYAQGMALAGPWPPVLAYVAAGAVLALLIADIEWFARGLWGIPGVVGQVFVVFFAFKQGFVRHDAHAHAAFAVLVFASFLYSATTWHEARGPRRRLARALLCVLALVMWGVITEWRNPFEAFSQSAARLQVAASVLDGSAEERFEDNMRAISAATALSSHGEPADVYSFRQAILLANGVAYRPRPTIQSYTAFTTELARRNAEFLSTNEAPATIFFDIAPIDERFPSLEDGVSWPSLLAWYYVVDGPPWALELRRRTSGPCPVEVLPLATAEARIGERIETPSVAGGPVWVEIQVERTILGRLADLLFRAPDVRLEVVTADGRVDQYRLVPELARSGFLLSPLIADRLAFARLTSNTWQEDLAGAEVSSFRVLASPNCYATTVSIAFSRLVFEHQDLAGLPGLEQERVLSLLAGSAQATAARPKISNGPDGTTVVLANAPTELQLPVPRGVTSWDFSYGLLDGAWSVGGETDGVRFVIVAEIAGEERELWSRRLLPVTVAADRGVQRVELSVPDGATRLLLRTEAGATSSWDWAFWRPGLPQPANRTR
jgi:hypothetical protein